MNNIKKEQILIDYIRHNLSPTKQERMMITQKYDELKEILQNRTLQSGSYGRFTSTTPVNDLDVIYIMPQQAIQTYLEKAIVPSDLDISNILESLATALRNEYPKTVKIEVQHHSVGIFLGNKEEFSIDIVPSLPIENDLYLVPEVAHLSVLNRRALYKSFPKLNWIRSDPKGYIQQAKDIDNNSDGRFRKATKLIKKWKLGCKTINSDFPLKSFHLELLITSLFKNNASLFCLSSIVLFFKELGNNIAYPQIRDRADKTRFIDEYLDDLSSGQKKIVSNLRLEAEESLKLILDAETEAGVLKGIESLLKLDIVYNNSISSELATASISPVFSKPYFNQRK